MRIPHISTCVTDSGFEACCSVRVASLLNSELLREYHYGSTEEKTANSFSRLNQRHLQNAREMLLSGLAGITGVTFEIRISVVPDLVHKAQGEIGMFFLIRCAGVSEAAAREKVAESFLGIFPILVTCLPEADLKLVGSAKELEECGMPFGSGNAVAIVRRSQEISLASVVLPNSLGFISSEETTSVREDVVVRHLAPWVPSFDDWGRLLEVLAGQLDPTLLIIRIRSHEDVSRERQRLAKTVALCEARLAGIESDEFALRKMVSQLEEQSIAHLEQLNHPCFDLAALMISPHYVSGAVANIFGAAISGRRMGGEETAWLQGGYDIRRLDEDDYPAADFFPEDAPFTIGEAACAFRFPSPPSRDIPGLNVQRFRANLAMLPPELDESPVSIRLFLNEFQGMSQPVHIDPDDRMRHTYIMGQTGTGKSSLLENMIVQDIRAGRGLAVVDPHGDMIDNILKRISRKRAQDVIVFDLMDRERPLGFNLLQWQTIAERDLIIDSLYQHMEHMYDMKLTGGPMFESYFRGLLKLLMGDTPRPGFTGTVLEFKRCLTDRKFRHWLLDTMSDQQVKDFVEEAEAAGGEAQLANMAPYVSSKWGRFTNDLSMQRIIGQEKTTFDFDTIMSEGKIFLVKLAKGRFGPEVSALLANMLVSRFQMAAMKRGELSMAARRDFFLYVDEAHNLPREIVTQLLSEARKYRLGLVLATQYCSQLGNVSGPGDDLLAAVFGNVGSLITFRTGNQDAELLAKGFAPYFSSLDIMSLPNFHGYARMNLNNQAMVPFSFRTELDATPEDENLARQIRLRSRSIYGQECEDVDAACERRLNSWKELPTVPPPREPKSIMPSVVNPIVLDLGYQELGAPGYINRLLKKAALFTIRDIVSSPLQVLMGSKGFDFSDLAKLDECLRNIGCCLPGVREYEPEEPEVDFSWDDH